MSRRAAAVGTSRPDPNLADEDSVTLVMDGDLLAQLRARFGSVGEATNGASAVVKVPTEFARRMFYFVARSALEQEREEREELERRREQDRLCDHDAQVALAVHERQLEERYAAADSGEDSDDDSAEAAAVPAPAAAATSSAATHYDARLQSLIAKYDEELTESEAAEHDFEIVSLVKKASLLQEQAGAGGRPSGLEGAGPSQPASVDPGGASGPARADAGGASGPARADAGGASGPARADAGGASGPARADAGGASGPARADAGGASGPAAAAGAGPSRPAAGASGSGGPAGPSKRWADGRAPRPRHVRMGQQAENSFVGELGVSGCKTVDDDDDDPENPWDADDPYAAMEVYRTRAFENRAWATTYHRQAKVEYDKGDRDLAGRYTKQARHCEKEAERNHALASSALVAAMDHADKGELDLHFFRVAEAVTMLDLFLDHHIQALREAEDAEDEGGLTLTIVTGKGLHSPNNKAVLKPAVLKRAAERNLRVTEPRNNLGEVRVHVTEDSLLSHQVPGSPGPSRRPFPLPRLQPRSPPRQ